jgi:hypothetical protein
MCPIIADVLQSTPIQVQPPLDALGASSCLAEYIAVTTAPWQIYPGLASRGALTF